MVSLTFEKYVFVNTEWFAMEDKRATRRKATHTNIDARAPLPLHIHVSTISFLILSAIRRVSESTEFRIKEVRDVSVTQK